MKQVDIASNCSSVKFIREKVPLVPEESAQDLWQSALLSAMAQWVPSTALGDLAHAVGIPMVTLAGPPASPVDCAYLLTSIPMDLQLPFNPDNLAYEDKAAEGAQQSLNDLLSRVPAKVSYVDLALASKVTNVDPIHASS